MTDAAEAEHEPPSTRESLEKVEHRLTEVVDALNAERNARIALVVAALGIIVGVIGLVYGFSAHTAVREARTALAQVESDAPGSVRANSCVQQQVGAKLAIAAADDHDRTLGDLLAPKPRTAKADRAVVAGLALLHTSSVRSNPIRDCSAAGIAAFLTGRGGYLPVVTPTTRRVP